MYSKETVLNDSYQELNDCLMDLLKYEMVGIILDDCTIGLVSKMLDNE